MKSCDNCGGTGRVGNFPLNIAIGVWPVNVFKTICPKCGGTGEIPDEDS